MSQQYTVSYNDILHGLQCYEQCLFFLLCHSKPKNESQRHTMLASVIQCHIILFMTSNFAVCLRMWITVVAQIKPFPYYNRQKKNTLLLP